LKKKKYMKNILISLIVLLLPVIIHAQNKSPFSAREIKDVRVATPGLFAKSNHLYLHLDSLQEHEYAFPLPGGKVISAYGTRGGHSGADIKTCAKDTIRAAFDGIVRMSKPYYAYGNLVVIRHPNGLETLYSHNFKNLVQSGDTVKAGQPIGLTGRTGRATTEHVHFETRINGQHFNPNLIFDMKEKTLRKGCVKCTKNGNGIVVKTHTPDNRVAQNNQMKK
jgi:murein DD-endopeptidase MepM/ murein hydrolase activator NlpD